MGVGGSGKASRLRLYDSEMGLDTAVRFGPGVKAQGRAPYDLMYKKREQALFEFS